MHNTTEKIKEFCTANQFEEKDINRFARYINANDVIEIVLKNDTVYIKYRIILTSNGENYKECICTKLIYFNQLKIYNIKEIDKILRAEIINIIKETYSDILFNNN